MKSNEKIIKITCKGADLLPIDSLMTFQGNLKTLSEKKYLKLRRSLESHGWSFPVQVWRNNGENCIVDGHQTVFTARKMLTDGWKIKEGLVPIDWIEAKDKKEAKQKILLRMSQYGDYDNESFYEFISTEELSFDDLKLEINLPQIDWKEFEKGYLSENNERKEESDSYTLMFHFQKDDAAYVMERLHRNREQNNESLDDKWRERCLLRLLRKMD